MKFGANLGSNAVAEFTTRPECKGVANTRYQSGDRHLHLQAKMAKKTQHILSALPATTLAQNTHPKANLNLQKNPRLHRLLRRELHSLATANG